MTMRAMVVRREDTTGEAYRRWDASARVRDWARERDAGLSQRKGCGTWILSLATWQEFVVSVSQSGPVWSTIAYADANRLPRNELRQNRRKSAENDRPALAPTGPVGIY